VHAAIDILADREAFERRVRAAFEQLVPQGAMSLEDRPKLLAPLVAKRRKLLATEEQELCDLEVAGLAVVRPDDPDPAILLEQWDKV
jgi:hypothetical protein